MNKGWLVLAFILAVFATYMFANSIYWIIIGYSTQYGLYYTVGTFIIPIIIYALTFYAYRKAKEETA